MAYRANSLIIRSRVDAQTEVKKAIFVNTLKKVGTVSVACEITGIKRSSVYEWRNEDSDFAEDWDNALLLWGESLESATYLKLADVLKDARKRLSPAEAKLIEMFLAGAKPEKYRQKGIEIDNSQNSYTIDWASVPDELVNEFTAGRLTLQDVYERTIQFQQQARSEPSKD